MSRPQLPAHPSPDAVVNAVLKLHEAKRELATTTEPKVAQAIGAQASVALAWAREQRRLLRNATSEEALQAKRDAEQIGAEAATVLILSEARQGELYPEDTPRGRGEKSVASGDAFSRQEAQRFRRLAELAPRLDAYVAACDRDGEEITRTGFIRWASRAQKRDRQKADLEASISEAQEAAVDKFGPDSWAEHQPKSRRRGPEPEEPEQNAWAVLAGRLLQAAATFSADKLTGVPPIFARAREEQLAELRDLAARIAQTGREVQEATT